MGLADDIHQGRRLTAATIKLLLDDLYRLRKFANPPYTVTPEWSAVTGIWKDGEPVAMLRAYSPPMGMWMEPEEVLWVRSAGDLMDIIRFVDRVGDAVPR